MSWKTIFAALVLPASMSLQIGCSNARPVEFVTGKDYIRLAAGETFTADRDMTLATESVIQEKDGVILDLMEANERLIAEVELLRGAD